MRPIDADAYRKRRCRTCINRVQCDNGGNLCFDIVVLNTCPTIEAAPIKHGHWIKGHCGVDEYIKCSVCRTRIVNTIVSLEGDAAEDYFDLCPKCGARMDGDSE